MEVKIIRARISPNSKQKTIIRKSKDSFDIKVREKPQQGKANKAVIEVLAEYLNVPKQKIKLIKGFKQRNKVFEIS